MRNRSPAKSAASSPPVPARISRMAFFSSASSLGSSSTPYLLAQARDALVERRALGLGQLRHLRIGEQRIRGPRAPSPPPPARRSPRYAPAPARRARGVSLTSVSRSSGRDRRSSISAMRATTALIFSRGSETVAAMARIVSRARRRPRRSSSGTRLMRNAFGLGKGDEFAADGVVAEVVRRAARRACRRSCRRRAPASSP